MMKRNQIFFVVVVAIATSCQAMRINSNPSNQPYVPAQAVEAVAVSVGPAATAQRTIPCPDNSNTTWIHPSEIAKDCLNAVGKTLVDQCQAKAVNAWDPSKTNSSISTVWETCCSLYQELDCYLSDGKTICPAAIYKKLTDYTTKVVVFFQSTLCHTVIDLGWRSYCDAKMRNASHASHPNHPVIPSKEKLVNLPMHKGPENKCFEQLEQAKDGDQVEKCFNETLNIWDPYRNKTLDADLTDGCCAFNSVINCLAFASLKNCNETTNLHAMLTYQKNSIDQMSTTLCKKVPLHVNGNKVCYKIHRDPSIKGSALSTSISPIAVLFFILLAVLIF